MLGVILLVAVAVQPSPSPPLKTIDELHSSPFCSAIHNDVAPAVLNLILNKPVVDRGQDTFMAMARDTVQGAIIDVKMERVNQAIGPMVQHLKATDVALARLDADARRTHGEEAQLLVSFHAKLERIADQQRNMLNVFSGTYNSYTSNELNNSGTDMNNVIHGTPPPDDAEVRSENIASIEAVVPIISSASKATPAPASVAPPPIAVRNIDMGLANVTAFAQLYNAVTRYKIDEIILESQVSGALVQAGTTCH